MRIEPIRVSWVYPCYFPYLEYWFNLIEGPDKLLPGRRLVIDLTLLAGTDGRYGFSFREDGEIRRNVGALSANWASRNKFSACLGMIDRLIVARPQVIFLCGYEQPENFVAFLFGWFTGIPLVLMTDSKFSDKERLRRSVGVELLKSLIIRRFDAVLCPSGEHADYIRFLAGARTQVFTEAFDVIDLDVFRARSARVKDGLKALGATGLGGERKFFFVPARLIEKKNFITVLSAYRQYVEEARRLGLDSVALLICGRGGEASEIVKSIERWELSKHVHLVDWIDWAVVPAVMKLACVTVLASWHDQWGNVVVESLAVGTPVLVSNRCGAHNVVQNGVNGFTFNPSATGHLSELFMQVAHDASLYQRLKLGAARGPTEFTGRSFLARYRQLFKDLKIPVSEVGAII